MSGTRQSPGVAELRAGLFLGGLTKAQGAVRGAAAERPAQGKRRSGGGRPPAAS